MPPVKDVTINTQQHITRHSEDDWELRLGEVMFRTGSTKTAE